MVTNLKIFPVDICLSLEAEAMIVCFLDIKDTIYLVVVISEAVNVEDLSTKSRNTAVVGYSTFQCDIASSHGSSGRI